VDGNRSLDDATQLAENDSETRGVKEVAKKNRYL
jgi:hypothetical protein